MAAAVGEENDCLLGTYGCQTGLDTQTCCLIYTLQQREVDIIINQTDLISSSEGNKNSMYSVGVVVRKDNAYLKNNLAECLMHSKHSINVSSSHAHPPQTTHKTKQQQQNQNFTRVG